MGPCWGGGVTGWVREPYVKTNCFIYFLNIHGRILTKHAWQESSLGARDSKSFIGYMWPPWGPRQRAPKGQNHANLKVTSSPDPEVEQSSYVVFKYLLM